MNSTLIQKADNIHDNMTTQNNGYDSKGNFDIKNNKYIEDPWTLIESYFKDHHLDRLVRHQLESYNYFVSHQLIKTINMFNSVNIKTEEDYDEKTRNIYYVR